MIAPILFRLKLETSDKPKKYKWQLFFKIFCFLHPKAVTHDSVEGTFLFEQVNELFIFGIQNVLLPHVLF